MAYHFLPLSLVWLETTWIFTVLNTTVMLYINSFILLSAFSWKPPGTDPSKSATSVTNVLK